MTDAEQVCAVVEAAIAWAEAVIPKTSSSSFPEHSELLSAVRELAKRRADITLQLDADRQMMGRSCLVEDRAGVMTRIHPADITVEVGT